MDKWARVIIDTHRKPLKNLDIIGKKYFLPTNSEEEQALIEKYLNVVSNSLSTERVERRCARAVGHWIPEESLVRVVKVSGIVNTFGFANKAGKYLHPEEAMFLLETNRIEIMWNNVPLSIQQAYEILVTDTPKYLQYRSFCFQGYHLKINKNEESPNLTSTCTSQTEDNEILKKLQSVGPKKFKSDKVKEEGHYKVFLPEHIGSSSEDLKFSSSRDKEVPPDIAVMNGKTIIGLDNSSYRYRAVDLPDLT